MFKIGGKYENIQIIKEATMLIILCCALVLSLSFMTYSNPFLTATNNEENLAKPRWFAYSYAALYGFNYTNYDNNDKVNTLPDLNKPYD